MLTVAEQELRRALDHGFTEAEIEEVKARRLRSLDLAVMKAPTRSSRHVAGSILRSVGSESVFMSPEGDRRLHRDYIARLDNDTILEAFRKSWEADHVLVSITGNAEVDESAIVAAYETSAKVAVDAPVEEDRGEFAYGEEPVDAGRIVAHRNIEDLDIEQVDFANGLRINLKKTDFRKDEIHLKLCFGVGSRALPEGKEGLATLANMIMIEGGLGRHSREDLKSLLAGRSAHVGFSVEESRMALTGSTIPEDLELTLQLLRAYFTDPGYRPEAVRLARKRYAESYKGMTRTAGGVWQLKVPRLLAGDDVRFGPPSLEAFNSRTAEEVRGWVLEQREMTPLEISVVGDIDPEETIELVGTYFGGLPCPKGDRPAVRDVHFIEPGSHSFSVPTKIDRGQVSLFWQTTDAYSDIHRTRRLGILARVVSEYLREEVREEIGGAYSPWSASRMNDAYKGYGYFMAMVKVNPQDAERIRDAVLSITARLYKDGTQEELFNRVLLPVQTGITKRRRTNGYWMSVLSGSLRRPQQLEWARTFVDDYGSMKVEEVNAYARQYLDPDKVVIVTIAPGTDAAEADAAIQ